jgi:hypothetical protein
MIALLVMPGLVPGIHVSKSCSKKDVMAGTSPAMTNKYPSPVAVVQKSFA